MKSLEFEKKCNTFFEWASRYPIAFVLVRLFLAAGAIWYSHVAGYVTQLSIGMKVLAGYEVSRDLLFDFLSAFVIPGAAIAAPSFLAISHLKGAICKTVASATALCFVVGGTFFSYIGRPNLSASLGYGTSTYLATMASLVLLFSLAALILSKKGSITRGFSVVTASMVLAFFLGQVKANEGLTNPISVFHLSDGTKLSAYLLHRVEGGVLVKKRLHDPFDGGTVFIPYAAIILVGEPQIRKNNFESVYPNDYPVYELD